ncbi:unnamed protein product [Symbiodinium sp. CCMP2592]|nr:unnamed protein product [Symbiodinium sp. CCMP2592]
MAAAMKGEGQAMDVSGLASVWEGIASVRKTARDTGLIMRLPPGAQLCDSNRVNAVANTDVLTPCLERMRDHDLKLPYITPLQEEIEMFFRQVHVKVSEKVCYRTAGEIKKMLSFIKRKANKKEEHIDMYMAGAMRQANIAQAAREALLRARSSASMEGSTGDENEGEDDESVERETDLDEFRRWLDSQPRGSQDPIPDPSSASSASSGPPRPAIAPATSSNPEALAVVPSPAQAVAAVPSPPEAVSREPSPRAAVAVNVPSAPHVSHEPSPPAAVAVHVPSPPEASSGSSGSGARSNTKQCEAAGNESLPSQAKATEPRLNRSKVLATAACETQPSQVAKVRESTWHASGNCEKCYKSPDQCNLMACERL